MKSSNTVVAVLLAGLAVVDIASGQTPPGEARGYFAVSQCRVVDTRFIGPAPGAPLAPNAQRTFRLRDTNLSYQGGSATGCAIPSEATVAMLNVVAVVPNGAGHLRFWAHPLPVPTGVSQLNYSAVAGLTALANEIAVSICDTRTDPCLADFAVFNAASTVHLVVDVVGYFAAAPLATTGPAGPPGVAGPQGVQGIQGLTGATGPQGPTGSQGPTGPIGPQGPQGPTGPAGPPIGTIATCGPGGATSCIEPWHTASLTEVTGSCAAYFGCQAVSSSGSCSVPVGQCGQCRVCAR